MLLVVFHHRGELISGHVAWGNMALAHRQVHGPHESLQIFKQAAALYPHDAALLANYGTTLDRCGEHDEAVSILKQALEVDPDTPSPTIMNNLGWALEQAGGDLHAAREYYQAAIRLMEPNAHPQMLTNLANINKRIQALG